jgi:DNA-binding SARP family transcriptional activator
MEREAEHVMLRVLGPPEVYREGQKLKPLTQKSLAILCYLAVRKRPTSREELTELLWTPAAGGNSFRTELHRLRGLPGAETWLRVGRVLEIIATTDLEAFERAVLEERFGEALALHPWPETLLRDLKPHGAPAFGDWLEVERARVGALFCAALRGRALELEEIDACFEALGLVRHLIDLDPLDESAYRAAMRLEYKRGHIQAALQYYEACRRTLKGELDLEPLTETLELAHEIERGSALPDIQPRTPKRRIAVKLLRPPALIGREREWAQMQAAAEAGQAIFISGPVGVGKTRLMMDFARSKGGHVLLEGRPGDRAVPLSRIYSPVGGRWAWVVRR